MSRSEKSVSRTFAEASLQKTRTFLSITRTTLERKKSSMASRTIYRALPPYCRILFHLLLPLRLPLQLPGPLRPPPPPLPRHPRRTHIWDKFLGVPVRRNDRIHGSWPNNFRIPSEYLHVIALN